MNKKGEQKRNLFLTFFPKGKKGTGILLLVFELLVIVGVIFLMLQVGRSFANSDAVTKANHANDMMMMVNTLIGVPGNAVILYPHNVSRFTIILTQKDVRVRTVEEPEVLQTKRTLVVPTGYTVTGNVDGDNYACIKKNRDFISLEACTEEESRGMNG